MILDMGTPGELAAGQTLRVARALPQGVIRDVLFGAQDIGASLQLQLAVQQGGAEGPSSPLVTATVGDIIGVPVGMVGPMRLQQACAPGQTLIATWTNTDALFSHQGWLWFVIDV